MGKKIRIEGNSIDDRGSIDLDVADVRLSDGTRLTERRAEEIAREALDSATRGRPSLSASGGRSPQLRLTVPSDLRAQLSDRARAEHRSVSDLVRDALERYLAS